ncbi:MAG: hypothetical protein V3U71_03345, partial [Cocleimonas sp.]
NITANDNSKFAFYLSTNVARFGILLITIFFSQVFISIYRYASRMSDFHYARADTLELLAPMESDAFLKNLEMVAKVLLPENIDFSKQSKISTDQLLKTVQSISTKEV